MDVGNKYYRDRFNIFDLQGMHLKRCMWQEFILAVEMWILERTRLPEAIETEQNMIIRIWAFRNTANPGQLIYLKMLLLDKNW